MLFQRPYPFHSLLFICTMKICNGYLLAMLIYLSWIKNTFSTHFCNVTIRWALGKGEQRWVRWCELLRTDYITTILYLTPAKMFHTKKQYKWRKVWKFGNWAVLFRGNAQRRLKRWRNSEQDIIRSMSRRFSAVRDGLTMESAKPVSAHRIPILANVSPDRASHNQCNQ